MKKLLTIFFCALIFSTAAQAQDSVQVEHVRAKLLSGQSGVGNRDAIDMGVDLDLEDGWYTYWRMPGDSGIAPSFDWSASDNVAGVEISWPAPKRFTSFDLHSFGYDDRVIFPLKVTPKEAMKPMTLNLKLDIVVCHEICIPATLSLTKSIEGKNSRQTSDYPILKSARDVLPSKTNTDKLRMDTAVLGKDAIVVTAFARDGFAQGTDVFVEVPDMLITGVPEIIADGDDAQNALLKIKAPQGMDFSKLFGKTVNIVLTNGHDSVERGFTF